MTWILCKRPVAFRVQRANDDGMTLSTTEWRYFTEEAEAARESDALTADCQALYVRDGTAIVAEWEPIASAPAGGLFLVCAVGDDRGPFVVNGQILWSARKEGTPAHLGLSHVTHWMPLPAPPPLSVGNASPSNDPAVSFCGWLSGYIGLGGEAIDAYQANYIRSMLTAVVKEIGIVAKNAAPSPF